MKTTYLLGLALVAAATLSACNKDDESTPGSNQTRTQLITAKNYKMTGLNVTFGGQTFSAMDSVDACQKDDLFMFHTNMTYMVEDAGDTCGTDAVGTWMFLNNDTKLQIISDGDTAVTDILQLDANTLKIKGEDPDLGAAIITFTAQ